jgi:hypothetical protein
MESLCLSEFKYSSQVPKVARQLSQDCVLAVFLDTSLFIIPIFMDLCDLPRDIIKWIIQFCPYGQWFRLSKELSSLASQSISPVNPAADYNYAIRCASEKGHKEVVEMLLKDSRVNPSAGNNWAIRYASGNGHKEIVEMLLKDSLVDPSADDNYAIRNASSSGNCRDASEG